MKKQRSTPGRSAVFCVGLFLIFKNVNVSSNLITECLAYIGKNSLLVLCTHTYIIYSVTGIYRERIFANGINSVDNVFVIIVSFIMQLMLISLWNGCKSFVKLNKKLFTRS